MSLLHRRIIYLSFITVFLIITPLIILYAAGFKIGSYGWQKTGLFIIDSKPTGAKIYLNGKVQQNFLKKLLFSQNNFITTPAKIKNLLPEVYLVKLELPGYWVWQKKLTILPGSSTYVEDIYLFKNDLPVILTSIKIQRAIPSPDKNFLALEEDDKLIFLNLTNEEQKIITLPKAGEKKISWSDDSKMILVDKTLIYLNHLDQNLDLNTLTDKQADQFKWFNDRLYYRVKNSIYNFDLNNHAIKKITEGQQFSDYLIKNDYLYVINNIKSAVDLNIFKISSGQLWRSINLPSADNYAFINPDHRLLNLIDQDHQILYLIDPFTTFYSPLVELINNVKDTYWIDNDKMIYANDFEIYSFNLASGKKDLITRISSKIEKVVWYQNNNYLIYNTDQAIAAIELDQREKRNITELAKLDKISYPAINQANNVLYFYGEIGSQKGIYKLNLQ